MSSAQSDAAATSAPHASPGKPIGASSFLGSGMPVGGFKLCANCDEECPSGEMCPWSRKAWSCHVCKTNYNRNTERCSKDAALKEWWRTLSREERVSWFRRNKKTYEPNRKHSFDDAGEYSEATIATSESKETSIYEYLTFEDWYMRQRLLGRLGSGGDADLLERGKELFEKAVHDPSVKNKFSNKQWLIGIYKGVRDEVGRSDRKELGWKRRKRVKDTVDHTAALDLAGRAGQAHAQWLQRVETSSASHLGPSSDVPMVPEALARNPESIPGPRNDAPDDIHREVIMEVHRQTKVKELEEEDEHEAHQARKIKRQAMSSSSGGGRPRKMMSELLSDASRIMRDRQNHINDAKVISGKGGRAQGWACVVVSQARLSHTM